MIVDLQAFHSACYSPQLTRKRGERLAVNVKAVGEGAPKEDHQPFKLQM